MYPNLMYKDIEKRNKFFRDRYAANIEIVHKYKTDRGCADCGWNEHHAGLEFDHLLPRKRDTVANLMGRSIKIIMEEIERCEVVCSRCHSIRTWNRKQEKL